MGKQYLQAQTKEFFSILSISEYLEAIAANHHNPWFTILVFEHATAEILVDEFAHRIDHPQAVFLSPGQFVRLAVGERPEGNAILFNREFYCIELHDREVSCQGLLFANNFQLVYLTLNQQQLSIYRNTIHEMLSEMETAALLQDEMLKNLLKNLLIRSNRLYREQISAGEWDDVSIDFVRKFSDLVEKHFRVHKRVEHYAELLNITPASLAKKLQKYGISSPIRIIKSRVITEAKRQLMYSDRSVKEVAENLGYDDPFYFSRVFTKETGQSPTDYKKNCLKI